MPIQTNKSVHHSPAPWVIDSTERPLFIRDDVGDVLVEFAVLPDLDELKANARLIAAAPELLASAKEAYENSPFHQSDCKGVSEYVEGDIFDNIVGCDCYLSRLKAAIDRAEGRNS